MGYTIHLYPFVWGAFLGEGSKRDVFQKLFSRIERKHSEEELKIRINSRYQKTHEILDDNFKLEKCLIRMLLEGYEGEFADINREVFITRAWIG